MEIKEIVHNPKYNVKCATVTLDYDELRDLSNALCDIGENESWTKRPSYWKIRRNIYWLFDLVKNGCVDEFSVEQSYELLQKEKVANKQ